ncbi:MAG: hypothetical protein RDU20_20760 [Desulfomonilaceae bacterium]|nr:hypothetical protein [Desulfomonilaceae bacterium]
MSEVLSLMRARKRANDARTHCVYHTGNAHEKDSMEKNCERGRTVVHVDFKSKDLQLLRYRARDLEEARFVMYKQSTRAEIKTGAQRTSLAVRVLVQKHMVQFYFYCPSCGVKVPGSLFPEAHGSLNYGHMQWREIEHAVQNEVRTKARDHARTSHKMELQRR